MGNVGKWFLAALQGAAIAGITALVGSFSSVDVSAFTHDPTLLGILGVLAAAIVRGLNYAASKI